MVTFMIEETRSTVMLDPGVSNILLSIIIFQTFFYFIRDIKEITDMHYPEL
jgi:hypothetical protein